MKKLILFSMILTLVVMIAGCGDDDGTVMPIMGQGVSSALVIPSNAVIETATLNLYVTQENMQTVNVHRVTAAWDEASVTWNNFGGAFDGTIENSFNVDALGWVSVDVSALVQGWIDGTFDNFGMLIEQTETNYPRAIYHAWENGTLAPYLEVSYNIGFGTEVAVSEAFGDAYIWELYPNDTYGLQTRLYTGWEDDTDLEKMSLVQFEIEIEDIPQDGCTSTIGYWKTHAGFGPQDDDVTPLLPVWLGDNGGSKSLFVDNAKMAVNVFKMKTYGKNKNGITKLYAQLLGAKLNILSAADGSDVATTITDADAFLADHDYNDWDGLSDADQGMILDWKDMLDDYNNGDIGPGHCE